MRELTAADYQQIHAELDALQRIYMWGPGKLAYVAMLLIQLAKTEPLWQVPDDPFADAQRAMMRIFEPAPAPVVCPPPGRVAVLPQLDDTQTWLLGRAANAAVHGRWRLWDSEWRPVAELDYPPSHSSGYTLDSLPAQWSGCWR